MGNDEYKIGKTDVTNRSHNVARSIVAQVPPKDPALQDIVSREFHYVCNTKYVSPRLPYEPAEAIEGAVPTAGFIFEDRSIVYNPDWVKKCATDDVSLQTAIRGMLDHEIGHYMVDPQDLAQIILIKTALNKHLPERNEDYRQYLWNLYSDTAVNLFRMGHERSGKDLRELWKSQAQKEKTSLAVKVLSLFMDEQLSYFDSGLQQQEFYVKRKEEIDKTITDLKEINFFERKYVDIYISRFAEIISKYIDEDIENSKKQQQKSEETKEGQGNGNSIGDDAKDHSQMRRGNGESKPDEQDGFDPIAQDLPKNPIKEASRKSIEDALDDIASRCSKSKYEQAKRYIESMREESFGTSRSIQNGRPGKNAGLESSNITWNDESIDFYVRKAAGIGVYIQKKPLMSDVTESYPEGNKTYQIEDAMRHIIPTSSPFILPGVTKRHVYKDGKSLDKRLKIPDCVISIDSSGSMPNPASNSDAVLAGFLLAKSYHANGSKVGVFNFSTNNMFLFPTRKLDDVYHVLCGFYGGGTSFDTEKFKEYIGLLKKQDKLKNMGIDGIEFSDEEDYKLMLKRLEQRLGEPLGDKQFEKKEVEVQRPKGAIRDIYESLDHILITDGDVWNVDELVGYFNSISADTRNTIIVVGNRGFADHTMAKELTATSTIYVDSFKDLVGISIQKAKAIKHRASEGGA